MVYAYFLVLLQSPTYRRLHLELYTVVYLSVHLSVLCLPLVQE